MKNQRNYRGKDIDMLTTSATIVQNAIDNQGFLITKRPIWADPFFQNLKTRIHQAFNNHLGVDNFLEQRHATQLLLQIQTIAINDLAEAKVQIEEDFKFDKNYKNEILKMLGFTDFFKSVRTKDQEALVQLLYCFKSNLTPELASIIVEKGTNQSLLDTITSYADQIADANITQENLKGKTKSITKETIDEFNSIYNEVMAIAKIARTFYKNDPIKQDEFSYTKIHKKLNAPIRTESDMLKSDLIDSPAKPKP